MNKSNHRKTTKILTFGVKEAQPGHKLIQKNQKKKWTGRDLIISPRRWQQFANDSMGQAKDCQTSGDSGDCFHCRC